ncbi:MAG: hypothetical protein P1U37_13045 [Minwuia sp.]|nr:hypothetical protein [Minwuia sp.]
MVSDFSVGGPDLGRIHAKSNKRKANQYFTGFLDGILASKSIEHLEVDPLRAECHGFAKLFNDDDAVEILADLDTSFSDFHGEIRDVLDCIVDQRSADCPVENEKDSINRFYGFLAGIACDGRILPREIEEIFHFTSEYENVLNDQRVLNVLSACEKAIADGVITAEEEVDICYWISCVVGDSYADTGLAGWGGPPVLDGAISDPSEVIFDGRLFVLTGAFLIGPRKTIAQDLKARGALVSNHISRKTDYLAVANEASRDWRQSHAGTKLLKAYDIRAKHSRPDIVQEHTLKLCIDAVCTD